MIELEDKDNDLLSDDDKNIITENKTKKNYEKEISAENLIYNEENEEEDEEEDNNVVDQGYLNLLEALNFEDPFMKLSNVKKKPKKEGKKRKGKNEDKKNLGVIKEEEEKKDGEKDEKGGEDDDDNGSQNSFLSTKSMELVVENVFEVEVAGSVWTTVLQVINCMIKANLIQIAISVKELGLIWGPIIICLIALMALLSLNLILEVNKVTGQKSYLIFGEILFGHFGSFIILICQFMSALGGCLSFIVVFNKVIPKLLSFSLPEGFFMSNDLVFSVLLGVLLFFYCYKQDVNLIKSAANYAGFAILLFLILTIIDFIVSVFSEGKLLDKKKIWNIEKRNLLITGLNNEQNPKRLYDIVTAIACIILSYSFHVFTFSIYGCMSRISRKQFFKTTSITIMITTVIYLLCGVIGYLLYYDTLNDSILDAIGENWLSCLLSLANVINVIMTFPITFAALKNYFLLFVSIMINFAIHSVKKIISKISEPKNLNKVSRKSFLFEKNKIYIMSGYKIPKFIEALLTLFLFVLIFFIASIYTELKVIFSLTGGVMGNILSFIFPSIYYLGLSKRKGTVGRKIISILFILFGTCTMIICIISTFKDSLLDD
jgi:amino acid permease